MSHEKSETVEQDGQWVNVYGRDTPRAGEPLPGEPTYATREEAEAGARRRSNAFPSFQEGAFGVTASDTLRGRTAASDAPPPPPPPPPGASPGIGASQLTLGTLAAWLAAQKRLKAGYDERAAEVTPKIEAAEKSVSDTGAAIAATPPPKAPPIAEPPTRGLRAFLSASPGESPEASISKAISALGLFATGAAGLAKGDARGSLAALTGAMQGWQEGDKERADRSFKDWQAKTDAVLKSYELARSEWDDWLKSVNLPLDMKLKGIELSMAKAGIKLDPEKLEADQLAGLLTIFGEWDANAIRLKESSDRLKQAHEEREAQRAFQERLHEMDRALKLQIAQASNAARIDAARERVEERDAGEAKDWHYDAKSGDIIRISKKQEKEDLARQERGEPRMFRPMATQDKQAYERLSVAPSIIERLDRLVDRILVEAKGENITQGLINRLQDKAGFSADIAEFKSLSADQAIEVAGALSGGQPRISILAMVREEAQPGLKVTRDVAKRQIGAGKITIANRLTRLTGDEQAYEKSVKGLRPYVDTEKQPAGPPSPGMIPVRRKPDGAPGWLPPDKFDPAKYDRDG